MTSHTLAPGAGFPRAVFSISLGIGVAACLAVAIAGPSRASDREQGAHVHGVGQMNLAIEGKEVEIELTAPGADIVGFEHPADTEADRKTLDAAVERLEKGLALFKFPEAARCEIEGAEIHSAMMEGHEGEHEKDHEHGKDHGHEKEHAHEKEHGDPKEHAHDKEHSHDKEHGGEHSEFRAHYHFECAAPEALSHVDIAGYFEAFPNARELEANTITDKGQGAAELTAANPRLTF